jgi:hypothetical protein
MVDDSLIISLGQLDQATLELSREYLIKGLGDKDVKAYLDYQVGLANFWER